jgi:hypothetical protein
MAFVTPTDVTVGSVLTASRYNEDVVDNMTELAPFFSAWTSWTPVVSQPGAITGTVSGASFIQVGRLVIASFRFSVTGTGTGSNGVLISIPVTAADTNVHIGSTFIFDTSASTGYSLIANLTTSTSFRMQGDSTQNAGWGFSPNIALASGDLISGTIVYQAAS